MMTDTERLDFVLNDMRHTPPSLKRHLMTIVDGIDEMTRWRNAIDAAMQHKAEVQWKALEKESRTWTSTADQEY